VLVALIYALLFIFYCPEPFLLIGAFATPATFCGVVMQRRWKYVMIFAPHLLVLNLLLLQHLNLYRAQMPFSTYSFVDGLAVVVVVTFVLTSFVVSQRRKVAL
jgi:hypothetical protein